ncbi:GyrI-like domain-containing protein [Carboxylicivirga linearis]|uniref:GyrI-like domain-containing protein n=1 Tax=Carboxylicivirga linearis TaxID=1628157 RepID=A0ABS5JWT8_9BACT|nr:GyrI-like domain-containing protein [Carboxylicivirga linearis]MBS2099289.1 GyrI-like domain-containing protein [Carboxylicivirga linearis]
MQLQPNIVLGQERKLVGVNKQMSLADFKPAELWKHFMPLQHKIKNRVNNELIALTEYSDDYFTDFNPERVFVKWALAEVNNFNVVPENMQTLVVRSGLYAVFNYKGAANNNTVFQYIFNDWLPASSYQLDDRPHFEILGEKYDNHSPNSEEEIWIPVKTL